MSSGRFKYFGGMEATEKNFKTMRTARYSQLGECGPDTKRVWFVLHGYGQLSSFFIKHFENQADATTCVIAPEGLSRFYLDGKWDRVGATWMTKEDRLHEIEDYLQYLDGLYQTTVGQLKHTPEIILLGFSQGTATAWRWAMKGMIKPNQFILWAGGPATDAMDKTEEKLKDTGLHFVLGDADEYITLPNAQKQLLSLQQIKPDAKLWTFQGTHCIDPETLTAITQRWKTLQ